MKFEIHDGNSDDYVFIEADTIEEVRAKAIKETEKRDWKDCWSIEVKDGN